MIAPKATGAGRKPGGNEKYAHFYISSLYKAHWHIEHQVLCTLFPFIITYFESPFKNVRERVIFSILSGNQNALLHRAAFHQFDVIRPRSHS